MKVKAVHTVTSVRFKDPTFSFTVEKHKIEYIEEYNGYLIDETTFIPMSNIREVVVEIESIQPTLLSSEEVEEAKKLPEDTDDIEDKEVLSKKSISKPKKESKK